MGRHKLKRQLLRTQMQGMQNIFISVSLEQKFLVDHLNSVKINVVDSMQCDTNQRKKKKERKRDNTTVETGT